jgi:hypothetical protein
MKPKKPKPSPDATIAEISSLLMWGHTSIVRARNMAVDNKIDATEIARLEIGVRKEAYRLLGQTVQDV